MRNVSEIGLDILYTLLQNVAQQELNTAQAFYRLYYTDILQHVFSVVADSTHTGGKIIALAPLFQDNFSSSLLVHIIRRLLQGT